MVVIIEILPRIDETLQKQFNLETKPYSKERCLAKKMLTKSLCHQLATKQFVALLKFILATKYSTKPFVAKVF